MEKSRKMSIGQQLFEFLQYWTDSGTYCVQDIQFFEDAEGRHLCIKEMYINYEENQVYLVLEDESQNSFHISIHNFLIMMGASNPERYMPLYHLRDETKNVKREQFRRYKNALNKYFPEDKKLIKLLKKNNIEVEDT